MTQSINVQFDRISKKLKSLNGQIPKSVIAELYVGGLRIEEEAKRSIQQGSKTGRVYEKYNPKRTHIASAAGQAPASDTGALVGSIRTEARKDGADVKAGGGSTDYAAMLEFGTSRMLPRPYFQPAFEKSKPDILRNVERETNKVIKKHGK